MKKYCKVLGLCLAIALAFYTAVIIALAIDMMKPETPPKPPGFMTFYVNEIESGRICLLKKI